MKDVARAAGVSQSTVSFVLNDRLDMGIAEATRESVLKAAKKISFRPNRTAQALRRSTSLVVGIVTDGIVSQPYAGLIVRGVQKVAQDAGYTCMVVDTTDDPSGGDRAVAELLDHRVAGVVYASPSPSAVHASRLLDDTSTIFVNCWPSENHEQSHVVLADEYSGGRLGADHVFDLGHRHVAFVGGFADYHATVERLRGFHDAAAETGDDGLRLPVIYGEYSISSGFELVRELYRSGEDGPTAVICGNDRMALGAYLALNDLGLAVARDVTVIGFDDQPDVASQVRPGLTTVALPHEEMGKVGAALLLGGERGGARRHLVDCHLVVRDSTRHADA